MTRFALLLALLPATAAVAGTHHEKPSDAVGCARNQPEMVQGKGKAGFQRLDKLPPANEQLTVIHSVDGCQKPVIVRYGIGGDPKATAPAKP
ncbi:hypothetical protein [Sphingomonas sp. PR090111-T3T-6A]|uniref:hypothetical protein n=1 Tax=Sphingomonas sp. PR090111-T3T-6A TaxID=685778 RepID=UPI000374D184|nr:hypothetical protein [Sphingomonas sp. PR090111-T3T-6A]